MRSKIVMTLAAAALVLFLLYYGSLLIWSGAPPANEILADAAHCATMTDEGGETSEVLFSPRDTTLGLAAFWVASLIVVGVIGGLLARRR